MALIFRYAARSDVGMVRAKNDDSAYVGSHLAILADGMGGHAGGDVASASTVLDLVSLDHANYGDDADIIFADEIQNANSTLRQLVSTNPKLSGMGTTLTGLLLSGDKLTFAHIGDSRAYRLKDGVFEQMSTDHTFVQMLVEEGRLTRAEAAVHPNKNVVMRVLGDVDASPEVDIERFEASAGEQWFLFSDGVTDVLPERTIERIVREALDLNHAVNTLVDMTLAGGAPDNTTAVAVEVAIATEKDLADMALAEALRTEDTDLVEPHSSDEDWSAEDAAAPEDHAQTAAAEDHATSGTPTAPAQSAPPAQVGSPATPSATNAVPTIDSNNVPGRFLDDTVESKAKDYARSVRRDLASRPHLLVGSASLATETGQIPVVNAGGRRSRAANLLIHHSKNKPAKYQTYWEEERSTPGKRWILPTFLGVMILLLCVVTWIGYAWTQTRYYVGESNGQVAIYNGVSQTLGPIPLSKVVEKEGIPMGILPDFNYQRVQDTIAARDLEQAKQIVAELRSSARAMGCAPGQVQATPSTPSPTRSAKPSPTPSPSARGGSTPSPSSSTPAIINCTEDGQ